MFDGNLRDVVDKVIDPIGAGMQKVGISADVLTVSGIFVAAAGAAVVGSGRLLLGFVFLILSGLPDLLDGAVAKAAGTTSLRGAFFDSVSDRVSDVFVFSGIAWYLMDTQPESKIAMLPIAILGAALLISYQRAKAESLGFDAKGGLMERAERFIATGVALVLGSFVDGLFVPLLWVIFALTVFTAGQRFLKVWKQATAAMPSKNAAGSTKSTAGA